MQNFQQFLLESEDFESLNEDYAQQSASNQAKMQNTVERIKTTGDKASRLDAVSQTYGEKAAKTQDDIAKAVYQAKISSNNAKKTAYMAFLQYLQEMQTYYQMKAKEIDARMKASNRRKV